jgi:hypothetical protein
MAGKPRLDMLEQKISRLERDRGGDALAAWVATLSDTQIARIRARLEADEDPATVAKDFMT